MRPEVLEYLACPHCGGDLELQGQRDSGTVPSATLTCSTGPETFPVESGVPRLLPDAGTARRPESEHQPETARAFGAQWKMYEYGHTTWGLTVEERVRIVLHELDWSERDLAGKVILDAGCGNGTLSAALADRGATVVALDLSDSVIRAQQHRSRPNLHFVQGNLFFPPLKPGVFDAIYSCGVFHHTPDTRRCFDALVPTLKADVESRYFVWLYSRRSRLFNATVEPTMKVTRRMRDAWLVPLCVALAPFVEAASRVSTKLGAVEYAPRSLPDRAIQLHDLLSPPFVWYHSFEEAREWARSAGLRQIERTRYDRAAARTEKDADLLQKYRTLCRPGFGMLCRALDRERARRPVAV